MSSTPETLRVKIFADGAEKAGMLEMYRNPLIEGFTTNPTLMRKAGIADYRAFAQDILREIPDRPISFEVFTDEFEEMERQASEIVADAARRCGQNYVNHRWLGGMLTNWKTVKKSIDSYKSLLDIEAAEDRAEQYSKKELANLAAHYAAEVYLVNKWVGQVLKKIEELGLSGFEGTIKGIIESQPMRDPAWDCSRMKTSSAFATIWEAGGA